MVVALSITAVLALMVATFVLTSANRRRGPTGSLSRETRSRDIGIESRARVRAVRAGDLSTSVDPVPARRARREIRSWDPVSEEEVGVSRRQFINRGLVAAVGVALAGFGAASLGFLWPTGASGFGGKILAGKISDIVGYIESHAAPFYVPEARGYVVQYPPQALPAAKKVYSAVTYAGMQQGFVALYQRCPHLGCRVPWCQTSQWFECPCHGSKYNRVGEKKAGPAPRGMDRFAIVVSGGQITINTGDIQLGPPIGTNTTGQQQAGPLCV